MAYTPPPLEYTARLAKVLGVPPVRRDDPDYAEEMHDQLLELLVKLDIKAVQAEDARRRGTAGVPRAAAPKPAPEPKRGGAGCA